MFEINSVKILYSLPINTFTLISDSKKNIFIAKVKAMKILIFLKIQKNLILFLMKLAHKIEMEY